MDTSKTMPQGSFGLPKDLMRNPSQKESTPIVEEVPDFKETPVGEGVREQDPPVEDSAEAPTEPNLSDEDLVERIKKDLQIELTEDDMTELLFKTLTKHDIVIVPGVVVATFRSLLVEDHEAVSDGMQRFVGQEVSQEKIDIERTLLTLSRAVTHVGKPGKLRSIGETPEERKDTLRKMSSMIVNRLQNKWKSFSALLEISLNMEMESGNS